MTTHATGIESRHVTERNYTPIVFAGLSLLIFVVLGIWGGLPPEEERAAFIAGMIFLVVMSFLSGVATWHFMIRPLPDGYAAISEPLVNPAYRQVMAILLAISTLSLTVGGVWDEIWHRDYGIPFGEDLFWRPHLMMYAAFLIVIGLAVFGWFTILKRGRGTLQQRFRSDPILSYITLLGTFLIYSLPFDPLWHMIYGADISAWSVPHIILGTTFLLVTVLFLMSQLSIMPQRHWATVRQLDITTLGLMAILSFLTPPLIQLLVLEWSMASESISPNSIVAQRPDWMLPALLTFLSLFVSTLVTNALKRVGIATLVLVFAFLFRSLLITIANNAEVNATMWLLAIIPAIGVDVAYLFSYTRTGKLPSWMVVALAGSVAAIVIGTPAINEALVIPQIDPADLVTIIPTTIIAALVGSWMGTVIGHFATQMDNRAEEFEQQIQRIRRSVPVVLVVYVVFLVLFIITAAPPVNLT